MRYSNIDYRTHKVWWSPEWVGVWIIMTHQLIQYKSKSRYVQKVTIEIDQFIALWGVVYFEMIINYELTVQAMV